MHLIDLLDKKREPIFICIGSMNSILDSVAPRVGTKLLEAGYKVIGTEVDPIHAVNLNKRYKEEIELIDTTLYQPIGVDAMWDSSNKENDKIFVLDRPIHPRAGFGSVNLNHVGELAIGINIATGYKSYEECYLHLLFNKGDIEYVKELASETFRYICNSLTEIEREIKNEKNIG